MKQSEEILNEVFDSLIEYFESDLRSFSKNCKKFSSYLKTEKEESIINVKLPFIDGSVIEILPEAKCNFVVITLHQILDYAESLDLEIPKEVEKKIIGWVRLQSKAGAISPGEKWIKYLKKSYIKKDFEQKRI